MNIEAEYLFNLRFSCKFSDLKVKLSLARLSVVLHQLKCKKSSSREMKSKYYLDFFLLIECCQCYRLHQERWFRKGFYEMEIAGREGAIGLPELKKFMQKVNCKIQTRFY